MVSTSTLPFDDLVNWNYVIHSLLFSLFFFALDKLSPMITTMFGYGKTYEHLDAKQKIMWDQRLVSMVHALIATPVCAYIFYDSIGKDPIYYYTDLMYRQFVVTGGYFFWDLKVSLTRPDIVGTAMVFHAILGVVAMQYVNLKHGGHVYACFTAKALLYEASTIPLNIKGFIQAVNPKSKYYEGSLLAFAISFIFVRCIWGIPLTLALLYHVSSHIHLYPVDKSFILVGEGVATMALNTWWGSMLLKKTLIRMFGSKGDREKLLKNL
ncbi:hypothetical protein SAMD00019534_017190 [Acytostelium subglobosum LB1]|uniref:hypothetical protein n=1 Tax=Acytostelium subglobosum LB1 TaxID=1410327 RepID=UPI000644820F|nr:hypothetical protein SAMD00019534_017190 [Acytostelium subglobosum LB1]GAM18544.1 hypothetical protein SAMD00019534_017190 [Acytostelium subglobosum LB1]|eukprot:XP_012757764.1 hypothetical protein SAMD00019534_017190 [Acytostelium subglobosum LB1]